MQAAVLEEFGADLALRQRAVPEPGPDEVLVRVRAAGVCATDLEIQDGRIDTVRCPHVPGHETAGEIAALGAGVGGRGVAGSGLDVGDAVVVGLDVTCGRCRACQAGRTNLCTALVRLGFEADGGLEEYLVAPARNVVRFDPGRLPFEQAAIIPDAVACMYRAIVTVGQVRAGDRVCLLGIGGLGFQGLQLAKLCGAQVLCTSRHATKLAQARALGADHTVDTSRQDLLGAVHDATGGELCDVVVDNIGSRSSVQTAIDICRPGGCVVLVGHVAESFEASFRPMTSLEKRIVGVRGSTRRDLEETVRLAQRGAITPFVSDVYHLPQANQALADLRAGKPSGRIVVRVP